MAHWLGLRTATALSILLGACSYDWDGLQPQSGDALAHFPLDRVDGQLVRDAVSGEYLGVLEGDVSEVEGRVSGALHLGGSDDHVEVTFPGGLDLGTRYTLAAWVRMEPDHGPSAIIGSRANPEMLLKVPEDGSLEGVAYASPTSDWPQFRLRSDEGLIQPSTWHHAAFVVEDTHLELFVDGVSVATTEIDAVRPNDSSDGKVHLGYTGAYWSPNWLAGAIDDARIYDRPLEADEIADLAAR